MVETWEDMARQRQARLRGWLLFTVAAELDALQNAALGAGCDPRWCFSPWAVLCPLIKRHQRIAPPIASRAAESKHPIVYGAGCSADSRKQRMSKDRNGLDRHKPLHRSGRMPADSRPAVRSTVRWPSRCNMRAIYRLGKRMFFMD